MDRTAFASVLDQLRHHASDEASKDMRRAFEAEPDRFELLRVEFGDLWLDYSKCAVSAQTIALLCELAQTADVEQARACMFAGKPINMSEGRAVLHIALRNQSSQPIMMDDSDVMPDVRAVLRQMRQFSEAIRNGVIKGATGKAICDVVNIGIGGSDLGPAMATGALRPYHDGPRLHFVSNIDGAHIADVLAGLDPETTLFIIASKTFTTIETMTNAQAAREWISSALGETAIGDHFAAVSSALGRVADFGINESRVFGFWDWVGGRYSLWSAIGLPIMIAIGADDFGRMLAGAHAMDRHFADVEPAKNMPFVLGLIGFWHRVICDYRARAVIPYDQRLARLPAYLQQLDMESNGKSVTRDGQKVTTPTGPLVWGEPGTNGQHAFFQLLHQGSDIIPVEFLLAAKGHEPALQHHHDLLIANCLAQSEALMKGRTLEEAREQLLAKGVGRDEAQRLAPHRVFPGNRPSLTIIYRRLDPETLGKLIALYEHRVFVEAQLFAINAFDQWGVELGKELATELLPVVKGEADGAGHDGSTRGLARRLRMLADDDK